MFGLSVATRIYIALDAVDMRRGFNGLFGLVKDHLGEDPLSGHVFLFSNRARTRVKRSSGMEAGFGSGTKRLEREDVFTGRRRRRKQTTSRSVVLRPEELSMLLNGLDLKTVKRRGNWYRNPSAA